MRINLKPAAAAAAATFSLLLVFGLIWPGHGIWLLAVGIPTGLASAYLWWRDHFLADQDMYAQSTASPFTNVGVYGLAGSQIETTRQPAADVPLAGVLAPVSALAVLLFVGGAIGSATATPETTSTTLDQSVSVIDRSRDGEPQTPQVDPPAVAQTQPTQTTTTVSSVAPPQNTSTSSEAATDSQQSTGPVKPIVVAAPTAASPTDDEAAEVDLTPLAANTFEYIVAEGDTLYDIAERYETTVETIMSLNKLDSFSFIHPGDVLLIPIAEDAADDAAEES